jgi:anaerobic selenocysteine-containing dehydrogenase
VVVANDQYSANRASVSGWLDSGVTRRSFMKTTGALAGVTAVGSTFFVENKANAASFGNPVLVETDERVDVKYSVCLQCHSACGIRCKVVDGVLVKIDGNPYHPNGRIGDDGTEDHLAYDTDPSVARLQPSRTCAKGQAGIQTVYNPLRIKEPLKRVGARGAGQWEAVSWDQAFTDIGERLNALRDLDTLIDPNAPELGPIANKVVFSGGRNEHGQKEFTDRFWGKVYGTVNKRHDHTSICEASHHVGFDLVTGRGLTKADGSAFQKSTDHTKPDMAFSEYVIMFGTDPCAANFPFVAGSKKFMELIERVGKENVVIVDPRCNVAASKGTWVPVKPGTDAALALGIARHIIDNDLHNVDFLKRPHDGAANPTSELNVTDSTLLVKLDNGRPSAFLRADEAGITGGTADDFVVWTNGAAAQYDSVDAGDLLPGEVTINGFTCKTAFELYVDRVRERTVAEYAAICGVDEGTIRQLATNVTSHGRKASVNFYRGPVQHANGAYTATSILSLNLLIGNLNWKGGEASSASHWHETGGHDGNPHNPTDVEGGVSESGVMITRVKSNYEDSSEYAGKADNAKYPAQRPWFPFAYYFNYQEVLPSIDEGYPYPIGALILYWNNMAYSTPAARANVERVLADESKIPLIVSIDIEMGETASYADYILPDSTYLERWSTPHVAPTIRTKTSGIRQPVVGTFDGDMNYTPFLPNTKTLEDIHIGLAKKMGWPVGLDRNWDWAKQLFENIGLEDGGPGMDYLLARGGRFEAPDGAYDGETQGHKFSGRLFFFYEPLATARDSMTGEFFDGLPLYTPPADLMDNVIETRDEGTYPLLLVSYKQAWHSMARTICQPWLVSVQPENFVEISRTDADTRGIRTGDEVVLTSASHPEGSVGRAYVTETIRPGVTAIAHSFGHWEMSSKAHQVDGVDSEFDASRAGGIAGCPVLRADPVKSNVTIQDKIGGSASFYDTQVQVAKV